MNSNVGTVSWYKSQLRIAINNARKLEDMRAVTMGPAEENSFQILTQETLKKLSLLETASTCKILRTIAKRKRKRQNKKMRRRLTSPTKTSTKKYPTTTNPNIYITPNTTSIIKLNQKPRQLREYKRLLRTFELLELLHTKRVEDEDSRRLFSENLNKLRSMWNVLTSGKEIDISKDIQTQWSTVFFGGQGETHCKQKTNFNELVNVRKKWDSFVTDDASGSRIPCCWVLPQENATSRWLKYRIQ